MVLSDMVKMRMCKRAHVLNKCVRALPSFQRVVFEFFARFIKSPCSTGAPGLKVLGKYLLATVICRSARLCHTYFQPQEQRNRRTEVVPVAGLTILMKRDLRPKLCSTRDGVRHV